MNKYLLGILGLVFLIGSVSAILSTHVTNPSEEGLKYNSKVCIEKNGELIQCSPNTLTNVGKNLIQDYLTGSQTTEVKYIALCNTTNTSGDGGGNTCAQPAVGDTVLAGEYHDCGLSRAAGTLSDQGTGNFSYAKAFTATCNSLETNVTSIFNSSTVGAAASYFAGNNFTIVTLETDDQLTVTWYIWVT